MSGPAAAIAASAWSAACPIASMGASARSWPSRSRSSISVATSVAEKVLVMTGTSLGPPLDMTTSLARRVSVEPGTWTMPTTGTRSRHASATATTSRNSPDAEMPTIASPSPSAGG